MSIWTILSWVFVAILTGINIFVFLKLKSASEQMLKMAFPGAKNMGEALGRMQQMMGGMQGGARGGRGGNPFAGGGMGAGGSDAQLKNAMNLLQQMQQKGGKR